MYVLSAGNKLNQIIRPCREACLMLLSEACRRQNLFAKSVRQKKITKRVRLCGCVRKWNRLTDFVSKSVNFIARVSEQHRALIPAISQRSWIAVARCCISCWSDRLVSTDLTCTYKCQQSSHMNVQSSPKSRCVPDTLRAYTHC